MNLGNAIKVVRKKKNLTQKDFAGRCEITQAYLSQIENNLREPNVSTLKRISKELEIPLPVLFFLSIDDTDIKPEKIEAFHKIEPAVKRLVNQFA